MTNLEILGPGLTSEEGVGLAFKDREIFRSKRLIGRLKSACDKSNLSIVGGQFDGQKAKSYHFLSLFEAVSFPSYQKPEEAATFNAALPKVVEVMLQSGEANSGEESYIDGIGGKDFQNLPETAIQMALVGGKKSGTVFRVVFGGTERMPLRALSYLLPPLVAMEKMRSIPVEPPQLQAIFANNITSRLNGLDHPAVTGESRKFVGFTRAYIEEFFPDLVDSVVFLEDTPLEKGSVLRSGLIYVAGELRNQASGDLKDGLLGKAKNHSSSRKGIFYGAAHLLPHDTGLPGGLVAITDQSEAIDPNVIISVGGYQEQFFYHLRHELKPSLGPEYNSVKTLQFFTKHRVPPYYMAEGGDAALDEVLSGKIKEEAAIAKTVLYDLRYLEAVSERRGDFQSFLERQRRR